MIEIFDPDLQMLGNKFIINFESNEIREEFLMIFKLTCNLKILPFIQRIPKLNLFDISDKTKGENSMTSKSDMIILYQNL